MVGAPGTRAGVTGVDGSEDRLVPMEFVAVTVKVYAVLVARPVTVTDVPVVVAVTSPGADVTVYSVMGLPPSEPGAVHATTAETSLGVANTSVGASGGPMGITTLEGVELRLGPTEFVAVTVNVYAVS